MAHELQDEGFHEIQLNGKQLVFLFMAATVVSVVIFLLGVFVGRGVRAERGTVADSATEGPTAAEAWRTEQIAARGEGKAAPPRPPITDDEIRASIVNVPLKLQQERGTDLTIFSPRQPSRRGMARSSR